MPAMNAFLGRWTSERVEEVERKGEVESCSEIAQLSSASEQGSGARGLEVEVRKERRSKSRGVKQMTMMRSGAEDEEDHGGGRGWKMDGREKCKVLSWDSGDELNRESEKRGAS